MESSWYPVIATIISTTLLFFAFYKLFDGRLNRMEKRFTDRFYELKQEYDKLNDRLWERSVSPVPEAHLSFTVEDILEFAKRR